MVHIHPKTTFVMIGLINLFTAIIDEDIIRYARVKKKAYVRMITNYGPLNIELHSDIVS